MKQPYIKRSSIFAIVILILANTFLTSYKPMYIFPLSFVVMNIVFITDILPELFYQENRSRWIQYLYSAAISIPFTIVMLSIIYYVSYHVIS